MYHLGDNSGQTISDTERGNMLKFIMVNINDITKINSTNFNLNTLNRLRTFLNNPTNGFKFNKAKFR